MWTFVKPNIAFSLFKKYNFGSCGRSRDLCFDVALWDIYWKKHVLLLWVWMTEQNSSKEKIYHSFVLTVRSILLKLWSLIQRIAGIKGNLFMECYPLKMRHALYKDCNLGCSSMHFILTACMCSGCTRNRYQIPSIKQNYFICLRCYPHNIMNIHDSQCIRQYQYWIIYDTTQRAVIPQNMASILLYSWVLWLCMAKCQNKIMMY